MTPAAAAECLEISRSLVYELCRAGDLPHHRVGRGRGLIRLEPADVLAYKAARRTDARPPDGQPVNLARSTARPATGSGSQVNLADAARALLNAHNAG